VAYHDMGAACKAAAQPAGRGLAASDICLRESTDHSEEISQFVTGMTGYAHVIMHAS
jgi:hypothetical protein